MKYTIATPDSPLNTRISVSSNLDNYGDFYDELDNDEDICKACGGTGMDKWEEYDCPVCFGEGYLSPASQFRSRA